MTTGTIKKVVSERGFGFISGEDGKEYFFHRDGLTSSLNFDRLAGGEKVEFEIEQRAVVFISAAGCGVTDRSHEGQP